MSVWDAARGKRVGQVGRVECDDRRRRDVHPLFDETALERVRLPGCLGVLGGRGRRRGEPSRLLQCRRSAAGSDQSSVRLWLGPLSQFPVQPQPLHREKERGAAGLEETCWFPNAQGAAYITFLVGAPEAGSTDVLQLRALPCAAECVLGIHPHHTYLNMELCNCKAEPKPDVGSQKATWRWKFLTRPGDWSRIPGCSMNL